MSTQDDSGISFSIAEKQQTFRLLELPPDLVDLLSNPNAPPLVIKSSSTTESTGSLPNEAPAVLCTPEKTYQIRQVQTSNSLFVLQTNESTEEGSLQPPGVTAIATIPATLELVDSSNQPLTASRKWHEKFKRGSK